MKSKILAAKKTALAVALATGFITTTTAPVQAGIPVIDGGNLAQNIMTAIESVAQTLKQIEQYRPSCSSTKISSRTRWPQPRISGIRRRLRSTG